MAVEPSGVQLLEAILDADERLRALAATLRENHHVRQVKQNLACRRFASNVGLEGYVDAELISGRALCWWIEGHWDQSRWIIESDIRVIHQQGQDLVLSLPDREASSLIEFAQELGDAVGALVASADTVDLTRF